ncbi:GntR family transcriptional regulator [Actinomadura madurae]|uniref:GntR family transcriptional regulator n=1 Tax=Actinomadura madurae TaxID=1993 RepID=UPI00399A50C8
MSTASSTDAALQASTQALEPLPPRPDNLTTTVFEAIRDNIVNARLAPGSRVSEASLASQLQVSKTPVREALLRLRHIGLVEPVGRGLRVVRPSVRSIRDAYEYRAGIEATAARYAANRASTQQHEDILQLAQLSLARASAGDTAGFRQADRAFHLAIADAARNTILRRNIEDTLVLVAALRERDTEPSGGDSVECAREHVAVAAAIRAGDPKLASSQLADHIHHVMSLVLASKPAATEG